MVLKLRRSTALLFCVVSANTNSTKNQRKRKKVQRGIPALDPSDFFLDWPLRLASFILGRQTSEYHSKTKQKDTTSASEISGDLLPKFYLVMVGSNNSSDSFPPEVKLHILKNLQDYPPSVYHAALVSKPWTDPALTILYQQISIDNEWRATRLASSGISSYGARVMNLGKNGPTSWSSDIAKV